MKQIDIKLASLNILTYLCFNNKPIVNNLKIKIMNFIQSLIGASRKETRLNTLAFASTKKYKVTKEFDLASELWFLKMAELKRLEDGSDLQNKLYEEAFHLEEIKDALKTWS